MNDVIYAHQIESAVKENRINKWYPFSCSICGREYGYHFYNGIVVFNGACDCSSGFGSRQTTFNEIIEIYENNKDNDIFKNKFLNYFNIK